MFPAFRLASPRPEILLVGSIEANRRTCASLMTEARAFARLLRAGRRPRLLAAFRGGKVFKKGAHFPEDVILPNMMINKDLRKQRRRKTMF